MKTFLKQIVSICLFRDNSPTPRDGFWIWTYYCFARSDLQMQSIPDWSSLWLWNGSSPTALEVSYLQCCGNMDEKYHPSGVKINKTREMTVSLSRWLVISNSWFATTWQGSHVWILFRRIYTKMEFSCQRRERSRSSFVLHHRHSRRDVTCKPAFFLTDGLVFKGPYTLAALRSYIQSHKRERKWYFSKLRAAERKAVQLNLNVSWYLKCTWTFSE